MFTFAGLTFVYQPMRMGMRTLYMPKFDVAAFIHEIETRKPMVAFLVPAMVELFLAHPDIDKADLSSLAMVSVGSAPIAPATLLRFQKLVPNAAVTNSYSMTEAGTAYCVLPQGELEKRPGSVGKPLPPAEIRVVGEDGAELAPEEVGEIVIKPAHKPRFYYKDPGATADLFRGDWLHTGDLGKFDADGYLYVVGRIKDVIIRGGFNIYASDVESVLYQHPGVREAAVVGKPHPVLGEDIAAYVVLKDDATVTPDELLVHCKEHLADYKVPRSLEIRTELPRNATGKVLKRSLVEQ
jgi:acyl-CoA synthetase (AMP-forming)/AMP-acid ligase II